MEDELLARHEGEPFSPPFRFFGNSLCSQDRSLTSFCACSTLCILIPRPSHRLPAFSLSLPSLPLRRLPQFTWVVSTLSMAIAQRGLAPELWVPFFSCVGVTAGTYVNVQVRLLFRLFPPSRPSER
jgi:hypothetical protein